MLESLRPSEYIVYRDSAAAIFTRLDGAAAVAAFGLDDLLARDATEDDLSPVLAFLEAQGYRGATTDTLARIGLAGLDAQLGALPADQAVLLGALVGLHPTIVVPGWTSPTAVAFDVPGSGLTLLEDPSRAARRADEADDYLTLIELDSVPNAVLMPDERMNGIRETMLGRTQLGATAEMLGVCDRILDDALEYVRARRQFGQAIGSFQAVQHGLAWAATDRYQLACLFDHAVTGASKGRLDPRLAQAVKAMAGRVLHTVVQAVTQAMGAISFTWEYSLNGLHRRAVGLDQFAGASSDLIAALGRQLRTENVLAELLDLAALVE